MTHFSQIKPRLDKFKAWLTARGAQVLEPTSEWEVVRFSTARQLSIIYRKKGGELTLTGESTQAWNAFNTGGPWVAGTAVKRKVMGGKLPTLRQRDGDLCFFCQKEVSEEDETAEHLVPVSHGGPNHLSNLFLAHRACNLEAGHLSAAEKIAVHVKAVLANLSTMKEENEPTHRTPPWE